MMTERVYRLTTRHRGTAMFGLRIPQLAIAAVTAVTAVVLFTRATTPSTIAAGLVAAAGGWATFGTVGGRAVYEQLPAFAGFAARRATGRDRWVARLPLLTVDAEAVTAVALPRWLAGSELFGVERPDWATGPGTFAVIPVAVIRDRITGTHTTVVRMKGSEFALLEAGQQHQRISAWGRVLGQFARDGSPVARVSWHEWASPSPLDEHDTWLATHTIDPTRLDEYRAVLAEIGAGVSRHDLYVTISIDPRRLGRDRRRRVDPVTATLEATRALTERCRACGLRVSAPLSPADVSATIRQMTDPTGFDPGQATRMRRLSERLGAISPRRAAPMVSRAEWDHVHIDGSYHCTYWIATWPPGDIGPRWLEPLLLGAAGTRTITLVMEPVARRTSRRRINAEAVKLQGEIHNRQTHGFRVPVEVQRAQDELDTREAEVQSGYAEYRYAGYITVTAPTLDDLDVHSRAVISLADDCGLELRRLDSRHDTAMAVCLPLGRRN